MNMEVAPGIAPVGPLELRRACGRFATGVAVVSARHGDELAGMTINSFASVSLEPPLVLWSLRNNARSRPVFEASPGFAISILSADQAFTARHFAKSREGAFDGVELQWTRDGLPLIAGAIAHLGCRVERILDGGDHRILIGEVIETRLGEGDPLLFFEGGLSESLPLPQSPEPR